MRIYVASSWRNTIQPAVVGMLRDWGHVVYDFKNPGPGSHGFGWHEIDPNWQQWTPSQYRDALDHPVAIRGHKLDFDAMQWCDACVLVLPSGRSASFELGWCMGAGKRGLVAMFEPCEPELMYRGAAICTTAGELKASL